MQQLTAALAQWLKLEQQPYTQALIIYPDPVPHNLINFDVIQTTKTLLTLTASINIWTKLDKIGIISISYTLR